MKNKDLKNLADKKQSRASISGTLWWVITAALVIFADQLTKWLAVEYLKPVGSIPVLDGIVGLAYVENRGAAFGIFSEHRWVHMTISTAAVAGIIIYMLIYRGKYVSKVLNLSVGMIVGGGIGNLIDRFFVGYVVDFVELKFVRFAVFNTADSFVCIGAALLFIWVLVSESRQKHKTDAGNIEELSNEADDH